MKKFIIITLAAIVAAVTLCSATIDRNASFPNGTIRFESSSMPALNCTMSMKSATDILRLMPDSIIALSMTEYDAVRDQLFNSTSFTYRGVKVKRTGENPSMTFTLTAPGYKLTVSDVSWDDIEFLFVGTVGRG